MWNCLHKGGASRLGVAYFSENVGRCAKNSVCEWLELSTPPYAGSLKQTFPIYLTANRDDYCQTKAFSWANLLSLHFHCQMKTKSYVKAPSRSLIAAKFCQHIRQFNLNPHVPFALRRKKVLNSPIAHFSGIYVGWVNRINRTEDSSYEVVVKWFSARSWIISISGK